MHPHHALVHLCPSTLAVLLAACSAEGDPLLQAEGSAFGPLLDTRDQLVGEVDDPQLLLEQPCGGAPEAVTFGIELPTPPVAAYGPGESPDCNLPDVQCGVGPATLQSAITNGPRVLVLEDGIYPPTAITASYLSIKGRELWAKNPGGAVLEFGVDAGGNDGLIHDHSHSLLRGLVFDVDDASHVPTHPASGSTIVSAWGDATDLRVEDCVFHGNHQIDVGIYVSSAEDLQLRRLEIDGLFAYGVLVEGQGTVVDPVIAQDIRVADIRDPTGAPRGVGLRMGETAEVSRIHARDLRWAGIAINGDSDGSVVSHVDLDLIGDNQATGGVGVYLDKISQGTTVQNFCVGPRTRVAVNSEWDHWCDVNLATCTTDPQDMFSRAFDSVIQDGLSEAYLIGVHFDQGTVNGHVEGVTFRNYSRAGITFFHNLASGDAAPNWSANGSTQVGNTFQEVELNCTRCDQADTVWNDPTPHCVGQPAC